MIAKLHLVPRQAWILLLLTLVYTGIYVWLMSFRVVPSTVTMYVIQPIAAALLAGTAHWMTGGRKDHLRHKTDKMVIIGSVLAIWFVVYFMSGIVTTYARNTLMVDVKSVLLNIVGFAVVAVLLEYVRYAVLLLGGRRMWCGWALL